MTAAVVLIALAASGAVFARMRPAWLSVRPVAATTTPGAETANAEAAAQPTLADALGGAPADTLAAFQSLYARWSVDYRGAPGDVACERAREAGLRCLFRIGTWSVVRQLDVPVILALSAPGGDKRHAALTRLTDDAATLEIDRRAMTLPLAEVERVWDGAFIALWRPPAAVSGTLAPGQRGKGVLWLRQRLAQLDGNASPGASELYDDALTRRVIAFQRAQQLTPDGIAGEETLVRLATLARDASTPSLTAVR